MHLSLPHKTSSTHHAPPKIKPPSRTAVWLFLYVLAFSICWLLSGCAVAPKPVEVGAVVQPNKLKPGAQPQVVAETEPKPSGYFQQRYLDRETRALMTPSTPTGSMSPTSPAGPMR